MSLFRFTSIAVVTITIAVAVVSNLTDTFRLVIGNARTVPIHLGLLALSAGCIGILAGVLLRLLAIGPRREPKTKRQAAQPEFEEESSRAVDQPAWDSEEPEEYRAPRNSDRSMDADFGTSQQEDRANAPVYDANYRVINAPKNPAMPQPQVNSNLQPDEADWGFDFDEDDEIPPSPPAKSRRG
jgi:hypothetical protein